MVTANIYGDLIMRGTVMETGMRCKTTIDGILQELAARFAIQFCNRAHFGITIQKSRQLLFSRFFLIKHKNKENLTANYKEDSKFIRLSTLPIAPPKANLYN